MDAALRRAVRQRAGNRCEYCGLRQADSPFVQFHIEHILPRQHGGDDELTNLCLSCQSCNLHRGPNLTSIDEETGLVTMLFHPRRQHWDDHFAIRGLEIIGRTPTGRATARLFAMNSLERQELRAQLRSRGQWP